MNDWAPIHESLLASNFIRPLSKEARGKFLAAENPVTWLITHNHLHDHTDFYIKLARYLGVEYTNDIPTPINNSKSLAYSIGPTTLSKLNSFPYLDGDTVVVVSYEPSRAQDLIEICKKKYLSYTKYKLAIAQPNIIRRAIAESNYRQSAINAESYLDVVNQSYSSKDALTIRTRTFVALMAVALLVFFFWHPPSGFLVFFILINIFYLLFNAVRIVIILRPHRKEFSPDLEQVEHLSTESLPVYTILVPLKDEAHMVPDLIRRLQGIDYPADKLDIKLAVEVTDTPTLYALAKEDIDDTSATPTKRMLKYHLVKVPVAPLSTKPRSCNYALQFAKGDITVIYDAEDWPDPLQLKKAYALFLHEQLNTLCVQARLNFYNDRQNLLTRFFSLEYGFWYDSFLPGLYTWHIPLPLGGTSNHFLTETLRKIGTWDPYNVTEDADMGWRLSRLGYSTVMMKSYTLEEGNSQLINWVRQRTRWQKGFLLTSLVHLRSPVKMWRQIGGLGFISSATVFVTTFMLPLLNPALWVFFLLWYVPPLFGFAAIGFQIPDWVQFIGLINLAVGNSFYIIVHLVNAAKQRRYYLAVAAPLMPLYWLLISVASYRAIYQTVFKPRAWEKTNHGLDTPIGGA